MVQPSQDPVRWKRINDAVNAKLARDYPNPQPRHPTVSHDAFSEWLPEPSPIQDINSNLGDDVANPCEEVEEIGVISPVVYTRLWPITPPLQADLTSFPTALA